MSLQEVKLDHNPEKEDGDFEENVMSDQLEDAVHNNASQDTDSFATKDTKVVTLVAKNMNIEQEMQQATISDSSDERSSLTESELMETPDINEAPTCNLLNIFENDSFCDLSVEKLPCCDVTSEDCHDEELTSYFSFFENEPEFCGVCDLTEQLSLPEEVGPDSISVASLCDGVAFPPTQYEAEQRLDMFFDAEDVNNVVPEYGEEDFAVCNKDVFLGCSPSTLSETFHDVDSSAENIALDELTPSIAVLPDVVSSFVSENNTQSTTSSCTTADPDWNQDDTSPSRHFQHINTATIEYLSKYLQMIMGEDSDLQTNDEQRNSNSEMKTEENEQTHDVPIKTSSAITDQSDVSTFNTENEAEATCLEAVSADNFETAEHDEAYQQIKASSLVQMEAMEMNTQLQNYEDGFVDNVTGTKLKDSNLCTTDGLGSDQYEIASYVAQYFDHLISSVEHNDTNLGKETENGNKDDRQTSDYSSDNTDSPRAQVSACENRTDYIPFSRVLEILSQFKFPKPLDEIPEQELASTSNQISVPCNSVLESSNVIKTQEFGDGTEGQDAASSEMSENQIFSHLDFLKPSDEQVNDATDRSDNSFFQPENGQSGIVSNYSAEEESRENEKLDQIHEYESGTIDGQRKEDLKENNTCEYVQDVKPSQEALNEESVCNDVQKIGNESEEKMTVANDSKTEKTDVQDSKVQLTTIEAENHTSPDLRVHNDPKSPGEEANLADKVCSEINTVSIGELKTTEINAAANGVDKEEDAADISGEDTLTQVADNNESSVIKANEMELAESEGEMNESKVNGDTDNAESMKVEGNEEMNLRAELEKLESPFCWIPKSGARGANYSVPLIDHLIAKEKEFEHAETNVFREMVVYLVLAYEHSLIERHQDAINDLSHCNELLSKYDTSMGQLQALEHVINASLAHVVYKMGLYKETESLIKVKVSYDDMNNKNKAMICAMKACVLMEYSYLGNKFSLPFMKNALDLDPDNWEWNLYYGKLLGRLRKVEDHNAPTSLEQLAVLEHAIQLSKNPSCLMHLAETYKNIHFYLTRQEEMGQPSEIEYPEMDFLLGAHNLYKEAVELDKYCPYVNARCAKGLWNLPQPHKDMDLAEECIMNALKLAPENSLVNHYAGLFYDIKRDFDKALACLEKAIRKTNYPAELTYMTLKFKMDSYYSPLFHLDQMFDKYEERPYKVQTLCHRGFYFYHMEKNVEAALREWTKAIQLDPGNPSFKRYGNVFNVRTSVNIYTIMEEEISKMLEKVHHPENRKYLLDILRLVHKSQPKKHYKQKRHYHYYRDGTERDQNKFRERFPKSQDTSRCSPEENVSNPNREQCSKNHCKDETPANEEKK